MKRRELKKQINFLCSELLAECVACLCCGKAKNRADVDNVMVSILQLQSDMISRISHVQPGATKPFFKKLHSELITRTDEIVEQIKELL